MSARSALPPRAERARVGRALRTGLWTAGLWAAACACAHAQRAPAPPHADGGARSVAWRMRTMGTVGQVTIVTADSTASEPAARAALAEFARIDSLMSNWTTTSEVARVNRQAHPGPTPLHPEVATVVALALRVAEGTHGAYDITVEPLVRLWGFLGGKPHVPEPAAIDRARGLIGIQHLRLDPAAGSIAFAREGMRIDLGGIAKGYAVDRALHRLRETGVAAGLVDLSGNMAAVGTPAHRASWTVGMRDPRDRIAYFGRVRLEGRAIATSGNYEQFVDADGKRYGHILDPRTGWPAQGLISATVLAPTAAEADAWDTALIVLGPAGARAVAIAHPELDVVLVQPADPAVVSLTGAAPVDTLWIEHTLRSSLTLEADAAPLFCVREF